MDGACTDGSCGNPPVLSGGSNDDCCDGGPAHPAFVSAHRGIAAVTFEGGVANSTRRMHKRALEDGAVSALLELNNTAHSDICHPAEPMVGGNRKSSGVPNRRGSPAHCDGSNFSPAHGGHGGEVLSGLAHAPGSPSPGGPRPAKMKRSSNVSHGAAAAMAAGHLLAPMGSGSLSMQHHLPMGPHMQAPLAAMQMPVFGAAAMQAAAQQQQYMQQQYMQQYMQGMYGYPWMPMLMPPVSPLGAAAQPQPATGATSTAPATATQQAAAAAPAPAPVAATDSASTGDATEPPAGPAPPAAPAAVAPSSAAPTAATAPAAALVDPVPRRAAEKWSVQQVADWMRSIHCEDMVPVVTAQEMDGLSLKAMYRTGSSGMSALHGLLRSEFPAAKSGQRLRLVEGLVGLFALPPAGDSGPAA